MPESWPTTPYEHRPLTTNTRNGPRIDVNLTHPVLFDHPSDHIPGMYFVAAALELHQNTQFTGLEANYYQYANLSQPPHITTETNSENSDINICYATDGTPIAAVKLFI